MFLARKLIRGIGKAVGSRKWPWIEWPKRRERLSHRCGECNFNVTWRYSSLILGLEGFFYGREGRAGREGEVETSPKPVTPMTCGLLGESSEIVIVPVSVPAASGENVILSVQLALIDKLVPQLSDSPKLALSVIPEIFRVVVPLFVRVTCCAELVVCSNCFVKVKEVAESFA